MINDCWKDFQNDFNKIFKIVNRVNKVSVDINDYIDDLNKTYKNLLNYKTNDKNLLYFGLNTFHFQIRFLQSQYDDSKRQFVYLLNHLYADYYKLFKLIEYHIEIGSDKNLKNKLKNIQINFPIYDDLSHYKTYKESDTILLYKHIIQTLQLINKENANFKEENSLNDLQNNNNNGIPIDNFIRGLSHEQTIMEQYMTLYKHYLVFFQKYYYNQCKSYEEKINSLFEDIKKHAPMENNPILNNNRTTKEDDEEKDDEESADDEEKDDGESVDDEGKNDEGKNDEGKDNEGKNDEGKNDEGKDDEEKEDKKKGDNNELP